MGLIPGYSGQKSVLSDGMQVDHISENTSGHGTRIQGITNPASYPQLSGDIGEVIESSVTGINISNSFTHYTTVTLTSGRWRISGMTYIQTSGAASTYGYMSITTSSGSNGINGLSHAYGAVSASSGVGQVVVPGFVVNLGASTTYYLNANAQTTCTGNYCAVHLLAQRIA